MEKILIAEPDSLLCNEVIRQLKLAGYTRILAAQNGEDALASCRKEKPELLVINMSLPDYFGLELPEVICSKSEDYGKPRIILLWDSFFVLDGLSVLEKKYRISRVIRKPYKPEQLVEPVKSILSQELVDAPTSIVSHDIPVEYIQIFIDSALNFFTAMTKIKAKVGQLFFKNDPFSQSDVSSRMEIKGTMEGTICISFEKPVAAAIVSDMVGEEITEFDDEVKDGVGEAVNIITGSTKKFFQEKSIPFVLGLPKIFTGKHYTHPLSPRVPCIVVPLTTDRGTMFLEICVQINEASQQKPQS